MKGTYQMDPRIGKMDAIVYIIKGRTWGKNDIRTIMKACLKKRENGREEDNGIKERQMCRNRCG